MYNKYRNKKTIIDGFKFDSKKEASRYSELLILQRVGKIHELELQPSFDICPAVKWNNTTLRKRVYRADFMYKENDIYVVEDVKGFKTKEYILKRSLFLTQYSQYDFREL